MKRARVLQIIAFGLVAVAARCENISILGSPSQSRGGDNAAATPTPTPTPSPTPRPGSSPSPTPSPTPVPCVPQTAPFVCRNGASSLEPILAAAQARVLWAPEGIYVANLVAELNRDPRVCATGGFPLPSDEISIKLRDNSVSNNFDVVHSSGAIQAIPAGPTTPAGPANVCQPAQF